MALVTEADRLEDAQTRTEHAVNRSELRMLAEVEIDVMSDSVRVRGIACGSDVHGGSEVTRTSAANWQKTMLVGYHTCTFALRYW